MDAKTNWSIIVACQPNDDTLLIVDWLLAACSAHELYATATPLTVQRSDQPFGMRVLISRVPIVVDEAIESSVDCVVSSELSELLRVAKKGFMHPEQTTVVASTRRELTASELLAMDAHLYDEIEAIEAISDVSERLISFDGSEVAGWYKLPPAAETGLLFGALFGANILPISEEVFAETIQFTGVDVELHQHSFKRGIRLGKSGGMKGERVLTSKQFTRKRRAQIEYSERVGFESQIEAASELVARANIPTYQRAIFQLNRYQNNEYAQSFIDEVTKLRNVLNRSAVEFSSADRIERLALESLANIMIDPDFNWIALNKSSRSRFSKIRRSLGVSRRDAYEITDRIIVENSMKTETNSRLRDFFNRLFGEKQKPYSPDIFYKPRTIDVKTSRLFGAITWKYLQIGKKNRLHSDRIKDARRCAQLYINAICDAIEFGDEDIAVSVAESGSLIGGERAVRSALMPTAFYFWETIVSSSIDLDKRMNMSSEGYAKALVPSVWKKIGESGPLALWEYGPRFQDILMMISRGMPYEDGLRETKKLFA